MRHIKEYISFLKIEKNLSANTVKVYENDLLEFQKYLGRSISIRRIVRSHIRGFLAFLTEKNNQPITRRRKLTTLRNYFNFLEDEEKIIKNPSKNMPMPKVEAKEPACLSEEEIKKLIQAVKKEKSRHRKRNEVIVRVLIETGIRLSELTGLDVGDIDTKEKTIQLKRKGNSEQSIPINSQLNQLLKEFLKKEKPNQPVIRSSFKRRMTQRRVSLLIQKYLKQAGVTKRGISCHSLRHSFCSRLLKKKVDIRSIQILAGHKSISTTERYLHIANAQLRKEVRLAEIG